MLSRTFSFTADRLARAIGGTFARRQTALPIETPDALTSEFSEDPLKPRQWTAFASNLESAPGQLRTVVDDLAPFLMGAAAAARKASSE